MHCLCFHCRLSCRSAHRNGGVLLNSLVYVDCTVCSVMHRFLIREVIHKNSSKQCFRLCFDVFAGDKSGALLNVWSGSAPTVIDLLFVIRDIAAFNPLSPAHRIFSPFVGGLVCPAREESHSVSCLQFVGQWSIVQATGREPTLQQPKQIRTREPGQQGTLLKFNNNKVRPIALHLKFKSAHMPGFDESTTALFNGTKYNTSCHDLFWPSFDVSRSR